MHPRGDECTPASRKAAEFAREEAIRQQGATKLAEEKSSFEAQLAEKDRELEMTLEEVREALGLGEVELIVAERAADKLPRLRGAEDRGRGGERVVVVARRRRRRRGRRAEGRDGVENAANDGEGAVDVQLGDVLAGEAPRGVEPEEHAAIEHLARVRAGEAREDRLAVFRRGRAA